MEYSHYFILSVIFIPLLGVLLVLFSGASKENKIATIVNGSIIANTVILFLFTAFQVYKLNFVYHFKEIVLYQQKDYVFLIDFYWDTTSTVFIWVGNLITLIIIKYCIYYLHLEYGYKRFFVTLLLFYFAYNFVILAGNFETLFVGWEFLGICSFLLIAFYHDRYLPVRNAVKVFSVYRIGDIGILVSIWASHHLWHQNITFAKLTDKIFTDPFITHDYPTAIGIAVGLLIAASAKSGQVPFSYWVPRAMEGPTPSSAIFYGGLAIHIGLFLLIRTMPFWESLWVVRVLIVIIGLMTAIMGYFIAKTQSTVKAQIAYISISQIGLMFVELALGLKTIAILHFVGNAFVRTYQLLVSPSVVAYWIREQLYRESRRLYPDLTQYISKRISYSLYILSLREFYLDRFIYLIFFRIIKKTGTYLTRLNKKLWAVILIVLYGVTWFTYMYGYSYINALHFYVSNIAGMIAVCLIIRAFVERKNPVFSWILILFAHLWIILVVVYNENFYVLELVWYLSGIFLAGSIGLGILLFLKKKEKNHVDLYFYRGHYQEYPVLNYGFLFCVLGLIGFPITPTFIGEDLIFNHIHADQPGLAVLISAYYIIEGITVVRIYAKLFLGSHSKSYHENPLPSS